MVGALIGGKKKSFNGKTRVENTLNDGTISSKISSITPTCWRSGRLLGRILGD